MDEEGHENEPSAFAMLFLLPTLHSEPDLQHQQVGETRVLSRKLVYPGMFSAPVVEL